MDIKQPRRILLLGPPDAGILPLVKDLTGSALQQSDDSIAGLLHTWTLTTNYYTATIPIWIDEILDLDAWSSDFRKDEAREVVHAIGAWVYLFRRPVTAQNFDDVKKALSAIQDVIERAAGYAWDGTCLAVATAQSTTPYLEKSVEEWEDVCRGFGFEYVDSEAKGKNEFGEATGLDRIREAMEATDWNFDDDAELGELGELDNEDGNEQFSGTFAAEEAEMSLELLGMKEAVAGHEPNSADEAEKVEEVDRMMSRLMAVKDTASGMPEEERKRFARRAVNDIMKDMDV